MIISLIRSAVSSLTRVPRLLLASLALVALSACGSDDPVETATTPETTEAATEDEQPTTTAAAAAEVEDDDHVDEDGDDHADEDADGDHGDEDGDDHGDEDGDDDHADEDHADEDGDDHGDEDHGDDDKDEHGDEDHDDEHGDDDHGDDDHDDHDDDASGLGSHEHGGAELSVAWIGGDVAIDLISPNFNVFGFEYEPETDEDVAIEADRIEALTSPGLIAVNDEAGCTLTEPASTEVEREGSHSEITVSWLFTCANPDEISDVDLGGLFNEFPSFEDIDAQWVSDSAQSSAELTPAAAVLRLDS